jgi:hypothetical protein
MPQKSQKQYYLYGSLLTLAPILIQALALDSKIKADSLSDTVGLNIVSAIFILITIVLAFAGAKFLMKAITYNWNPVSTLNPYPELYKKLIILGIAILVIVISLAIKFSRA